MLSDSRQRNGKIQYDLFTIILDVKELHRFIVYCVVQVQEIVLHKAYQNLSGTEKETGISTLFHIKR